MLELVNLELHFAANPMFHEKMVNDVDCNDLHFSFLKLIWWIAVAYRLLHYNTARLKFKEVSIITASCKLCHHQFSTRERQLQIRIEIQETRKKKANRKFWTQTWDGWKQFFEVIAIVLYKKVQEMLLALESIISYIVPVICEDGSSKFFCIGQVCVKRCLTVKDSRSKSYTLCRSLLHYLKFFNWGKYLCLCMFHTNLFRIIANLDRTFFR